jgi:hypothetical protein
MVRVPASLALVGMVALALAACGSPETTPAAEETTAAEPAVEQTPVMPEDAPPQEEEAGPDETVSADAGSCTAEVGAAAATRLAERCTMVSPATHPPCNPANPCALIQDEIDRACGQYGPSEAKPAECTA